MLAADYPFLDVMWTMLVFFLWVIWFWLLITVFADVFRRRDISGGSKVLWCIFVIILPYLGVFIYLLTQHDEMAQRNMKQVQAQEQYIRRLPAEAPPPRSRRRSSSSTAARSTRPSTTRSRPRHSLPERRCVRGQTPWSDPGPPTSPARRSRPLGEARPEPHVRRMRRDLPGDERLALPEAGRAVEQRPRREREHVRDVGQVGGCVHPHDDQVVALRDDGSLTRSGRCVETSR